MGISTQVDGMKAAPHEALTQIADDLEDRARKAIADAEEARKEVKEAEERAAALMSKALGYRAEAIRHEMVLNVATAGNSMAKGMLRATDGRATGGFAETSCEEIAGPRPFAIGTEFRFGEGKWRCTDVGTRTILAIRLDKVKVGGSHPRMLAEDQAAKEGWFNGPPYAVVEQVFDEDSLEDCEIIADAADGEKQAGGLMVDP